jgi:hypothetical protein
MLPCVARQPSILSIYLAVLLESQAMALCAYRLSLIVYQVFLGPQHWYYLTLKLLSVIETVAYVSKHSNCCEVLVFVADEGLWPRRVVWSGPEFSP